MIKNKKQLFIVIGAFALILLLGTASYAFFNYTRTGGANNLGTGRIYFNTTESRTVSLTDVFPVSSQNLDTSTLSSISVGIVGDTTYPGGEEYQVTLVDVNNTINNKTVPIHYIATYTATTGKTIGEESNTYFSDRGSTDNVYILTEEGLVTEGKQVLVGYLKEGAAGIDGVLTIKAWISSDDIAISDTYNGTESDPMGTTTEWVRGRTVITTTEWNGFTGNGALSFKVKTEANEGTWVQPICKRATVLHTETCTQSSNYCAGDGYTGNNTTITYGNLGTAGNTPATGDAFDCDVNKDGIVNVDANGNSTERFYYVSPYYDTNTQTFDNTTATLIYYSNTYNGAISTNGAAYHSSDNWHGPVTAVTHLPSTSQWSNITLKNTSRTILAEDGSTHNSTTTGGGTLPTAFMYSGKAARLLTAQELMRGCGLTQVGSYTTGELSGCNFIFEGTKYSDSSKATYGPWLETPLASDSGSVWFASAVTRSLSSLHVGNPGRGARPVIDVPISDIEY